MILSIKGFILPVGNDWLTGALLLPVSNQSEQIKLSKVNKKKQNFLQKPMRKTLT